jgi:hypothetical protein
MARTIWNKSMALTFSNRRMGTNSLTQLMIKRHRWQKVFADVVVEVAY